MPRPSKGARLYLRKFPGRPPVWVIRDGTSEVSTGQGAGERAEAEKQLQTYLTKKHKPDFRDGDPTRVLIADILTLYSDERAPLLARPDVVASAVPHLIAFWGSRTASEISPGQCRAYVDWRCSFPQARYKDPSTAPKVGSQTARRELEVFSSAIGYAYREHKLERIIPIALPEKAPPRERYLTRSEAARFLLAQMGWIWVSTDLATRQPKWVRTGEKRPHVARFILIGLYTGTRHDAIVRLRWKPDDDNGWVDLKKGLIYRKGIIEQETDKRRPPVPISRRLRSHLERWNRDGDPLVINYDGDEILRMKRAWHSSRIAACLDDSVTPHVLRHTFASWGVMKGAPMSLVAGALGTTERIVQNVYGHLAPAYLRGIVDLVTDR